jgi:hypothetical protein
MASTGTITGADTRNSIKQIATSSQGGFADDNATVYQINAGVLTTCPHIRVTFGDFNFNIIIDTGSQVSVLSEEVYLKLKLRDEFLQELPVQSVVLISAFGSKTSRVKRQSLIPLKINGDEFENNFLICPQLVSPGLFGADFLYLYKFSIDLGAGCMTRTVSGREPEIVEYPFVREKETGNADVETSTEEVEDEEICVQRVTYEGKMLLRPTVTRPSSWYRGIDREQESAKHGKRREESRHGDEEVHVLDRDFEYVGEAATSKDADLEGEEEYGWAPFDEEVKIEKINNDLPRGEFYRHGTQEHQPVRDPCENEDVINRTMGALSTLNLGQKAEVEEILRKYQRSFSSIPGLYIGYEYEFEVEDHAPFTTRERPIPYAIRRAVREQIEMMVEQGIIEPATSPYCNPLVIVPKANKAPRICLDARRLNAVTIADAERTQPMCELLQQFDGVEFLSSLDLTAAFLQISMKTTCRKYTAFLFDSQQYQFRRMAYGLKNSGCALIRAMRRIFGPETHSYLCQYSNDLYIHSNSYEQHKQHVDHVLKKLMENGFTINLNKCKFFQKSIKSFRRRSLRFRIRRE